MAGTYASPSGGQSGEPTYPPTAFHFRVSFEGREPSVDTSFQEVSGISSELQTEDVIEGGENRFVHKLPKGVTHPNLVLKRGVAELSSPLVGWCRAALEGDMSAAITPASLQVMLLDQNREPIRSWSFVDAYPVKWDVDSFNSTKNEVAIETIELTYKYSTREK